MYIYLDMYSKSITDSDTVTVTFLHGHAVKINGHTTIKIILHPIKHNESTV